MYHAAHWPTSGDAIIGIDGRSLQFSHVGMDVNIDHRHMQGMCLHCNDFSQLLHPCIVIFLTHGIVCSHCVHAIVHLSYTHVMVCLHVQ